MQLLIFSHIKSLLFINCFRSVFKQVSFLIYIIILDLCFPLFSRNLLARKSSILNGAKCRPNIVLKFMAPLLLARIFF
jgi:hypothetical protein